MARIFIDGFDKYGPAGTGYSLSTYPPYLTAVLEQVWTLVNFHTFSNAWINLTASLNGVSGVALQLNGSSDGAVALTKTLPGNYSRLVGGVRFSADLNGAAANSPGIFFNDGSTTQCSVVVAPTSGFIKIYNGTANGTLIATSSASVLANTSHYLEWDITFGASASYTIYLDGTSILTGTGNTKTTGNSYANGVGLGSQFGDTSGSSLTVDDFYLFDTTGSVCNAVLRTNPRVATQLPSGEAQTNFSNNGNILGNSYQGSTSANAPGANELFLLQVNPVTTMTINSVGCIPNATSGGANFKAVIYSDSGGVPSTLLSSGTQVTGTTSGTALIGNLVTPQALVANTPYWIGFITDTSVVLQEAATTTLGQKASNTYSSGAPGTAPSMTISQPTWAIWGNCTGAANFASVAANPGQPTYSNISDNNVDAGDLYTFPAIVTPTYISAVYTMLVSILGEISGSGARTVDINISSSGTVSAGSNPGFSPAAGELEYYSSWFDTDPATGVAWTQAGVNAAEAGQSIVT